MDPPHMGTFGRYEDTFLAVLYLGFFYPGVFVLSIESSLNEHCATGFSKEAHVCMVEFHLLQAVSKCSLSRNFIVARFEIVGIRIRSRGR